MQQVKPHNTGLVFGGVLALWHLAWSLLVMLGLAKPLLDFIMALHFLNVQYSINPFSLGNAILLVVVTGIIGYVVGFVVGWLWNAVHKSLKAQ